MSKNNLYKVIVDIAEYNSYIVSIEANSQEEANRQIMALSKIPSKTVKFNRVQEAVKKVGFRSPMFDEAELIGSYYFNPEKKSFSMFSIENIKSILKKTNKLKFCYRRNIIEYNRYSIEIETPESIDYAIQKIKMNRSKYTNSYIPTLLQVDSREYFENYQQIIILESNCSR